jgi:hypothetical protein
MSFKNKRLWISDATFLREVEYLEKYLVHLSEGVQEHSRDMHMNLHDDITKFGVENETSLRHLYEDDLLKVPAYYHHSSFLLIYALLESTMQSICKDVYKELNLPVAHIDLRGNNYFESTLKYLQCFTPIPQQISDKANDFKQYQKLRNSIVHNGSTVSNKTPDSKHLLFAKDITYDEDGSFRINNTTFLNSFLKKVSSFVTDYVAVLNSLELIPVIISRTSAIKFYTQEEYDRVYNSLGDEDDSPF